MKKKTLVISIVCLTIITLIVIVNWDKLGTVIESSASASEYKYTYGEYKITDRITNEIYYTDLMKRDELYTWLGDDKIHFYQDGERITLSSVWKLEVIEELRK